jgi:hypothetical protein
MKTLTLTAAVLCAALAPLAAAAQAITLTPASPQPSGLSKGLAVNYATLPSHVRSLGPAKATLAKNGKPGTPLPGLSFDDTKEGDPTLTSGIAMKVAADISGYIKFDRAGTYTLEFLSNDGLEIAIGGQNVGTYDGIHSCGYVGEIDVNVPSPGYYALEATYFQRKGTACLMMEWGPDSDGLELVPNSAFYH